MKMLTTSLLTVMMALGFAGSSMAAGTQEANKTEKQAATKAPVKAKTYVVKRGDTLAAIAAHYKVPVNTLKSLNKLRDDKLKVGMTMRLR